jgi:hypothetical protein
VLTFPPRGRVTNSVALPFKGEGNNSGKTFEKPSLLQYRHAGLDPVLMPLCDAFSVIKYFLDPGLRRGDDNAGLVEFCKGIKGKGEIRLF